MNNAQPVIETNEPATRQACEPCRRKKTKCTAERPICSYCKRLGDHCHYLPRGRPGGTTRRLRQPETTRSTRRHTRTHTERDDTEISSQTNCAAKSETIEYPDPSLPVIQHFVDIYRTTIHLQPLPLFMGPNLAEKLHSGPQYLLWSFMSLMLHFSSHDFFNGQELAAASFYSQVAQQAVREMADEGMLTTELIQALCLITLKHYKTQQLGRAWMTTGTAVRLEAMRRLSSDSASGQWEQSSIRISWLVHVLERFSVPPLSDTSCLEIPDYPDLTRIPPPPHPFDARESGREASHVLHPPTTGTDNVAIISHSMRITTIWGELKSYLHKLRQGKTETPWSPDSIYTRINLELITFESNTPKRLFLCNAHLSSRTRDETSKNLEYWNRFMVGQIMWHATHAIINHPFIHLFLLASRESIPPSCFFLQQRIDTAIYHCNWTVRLLERFNSLMDIVDPMVADAIAGTATVSWLFQFSKDQKIAQDAQNNLTKCESFLSHVAKTWPHVSHRMDALRNLRALAQENHRRNPSQGTKISFQPAWFWDILAPKPNTARVQDSVIETKSEINLKSHFVLPLDDGTDTNVDHTLQGFDIDPFFLTPGALELFNIDSLSHDFFQIDPWNQEF